ncbi:hypothetical protein [Eubacterium xylanophilum]|uniref:hypothetical protein n=1 Tax=Eubacterium xylanophilum TaxID=39497 RepID=UPI00047E43D1|nr:hypothetical protein [Eubacterium xylanophilum]
MKIVKSIAKSCIFLTILVISLLIINHVLEAKYILKNTNWPTTSSYRQFYNMEKNSVDVLFLGSSVTVNAFIPQEIYNNFGIRSYNLGSEQQSIFLSYYWLKEALRFQKPKVVVLDAKFMVNNHPEEVINTTEGLARKCLDPMKWSGVKAEAVHNLCQLDESQSELSYYLTNIRYHARWTELQEYDFESDLVDKSPLKGYAPIKSLGPNSYTTYEKKDSNARAKFVPLMQEYLDKTVKLCKENNIKFILVDLPGNTMNDGINNTHEEYAKNMGIDYYNICRTDYYNQIGAKLPEESIVGHNNIWGAIKTSRFFGDMLQSTYGLPPTHDEQYEATKADYEQTKKCANLLRIGDQSEYLQALDNNRFAVFMTAHGDCSSILRRHAIKSGLKKLGLKCSYNRSPWKSYMAAIIEGNVVKEQASREPLSFNSNFRDGRSVYSLQSSGKDLFASSSMLIEGEEQSRGINGLNILVYDLDTCKPVDKVTFQGKSVIH